MESVSSNPSDALVFQFEGVQDSLNRCTAGDIKPLDVRSIISDNPAVQEAVQPSVEKLEIWVNGVKRVIYVPLQEKQGNVRSSECGAAPTGTTAVVTPRSPPVELSTITSSSSGPPVSQDASATLRTVGTNTADQHLTRCVATVAPQIVRESDCTLVSSPTPKLSATNVSEILAIIKRERASSPKDCFDYRQNRVVSSFANTSVNRIVNEKSTTAHVRLAREKPRRLPGPCDGGLNLPADELARVACSRLLPRSGPLVSQDASSIPRSSHSLNRQHQPPVGPVSYPTGQHLPPLSYPSGSHLPPGQHLPHVSYPSGQHLPPALYPPGRHQPPIPQVSYPLQPVQGPGMMPNSRLPSGLPFGAENNLHFPHARYPLQQSLHMMDTAARPNDNLMLPRDILVPQYSHLISAVDTVSRQRIYSDALQRDGTLSSSSSYPICPNFRELPVPNHPIMPPPVEHLRTPGTYDIGHRLVNLQKSMSNGFVRPADCLPGKEPPFLPSGPVCRQRSPGVLRPELDQYAAMNMSQVPGLLSHSKPHNQLQATQPPYSVQNLFLSGIANLRSAADSAPRHFAGTSPLSQSFNGFIPCAPLAYRNPCNEHHSTLRPTTNHNLLDASGSMYRSFPASEQPLQPPVNKQIYDQLAQHGYLQQMLGCIGGVPEARPSQVPSNPTEMLAHNLRPVSYSPSNMMHPTSALPTPGMRPGVQSFPINDSSSLMVSNLQHTSALSFTRLPSTQPPPRLQSPDLVQSSNGLTVSTSLESTSTSCHNSSVQSCDASKGSNRLRFFNPNKSSRVDAPSLYRVNELVSISRVENPSVSSICESLVPKSSAVVVPLHLRPTSLIECESTKPSLNKVFETEFASRTLRESTSEGTAAVAANTANSTLEGNSASARVNGDEEIGEQDQANVGTNCQKELAETLLDHHSTDRSSADQHRPNRSLTDQPDPNSSVLDQPGPNGSFPESPQSQIFSELMNTIDKISDDVSMQKWLDSLMDNISESSQDNFDHKTKSRAAVAVRTNTTVQNTGESGINNVEKRCGAKKNRRTWIGIKSIEAEMAQQSSDTKKTRRKRRRLTLKSGQSPDQSCDGSSDSWHPDSFAGSESSSDIASVSSAQSLSSCSWSSDDSVTIGKRRRKRSRNSFSSKSRPKRFHRVVERHAERSRATSPWIRIRPLRHKLRECHVSLEVLSLNGKEYFSARNVDKILCCRPSKVTEMQENSLDSSDSYNSWQPHKNKTNALKPRKRKLRSYQILSGSDSDDSYN